jgi:hypothetical protein
MEHDIHDEGRGVASLLLVAWVGRFASGGSSKDDPKIPLLF